MKENELIQIIDLGKIVIKAENQLTMNMIKSSLLLINEFTQTYNLEKEKLPYHLNLIDELRANENAHSRILVKLLGYNKQNDFKILKSFIEYLKSSIEGFIFSSSVKKPKISTERHRIDALIIDDDFAIIIENKIHHAQDQNEQLKKYIKKVEQEYQLARENIYVVYLSGWGGGPSTNSFPLDLREQFKNRYAEISFKEDIITWLLSVVLPAFQNKEDYLKSALTQYIDHLKGLFMIRENEKDMNKELIGVINGKLELSSVNFKDNIEKINQTIQDLYKTQNYLDSVLKINWFEYWHNLLNEKYPDDTLKNYDNLNHYPSVGVFLKYQEIGFAILIQMHNSSLYYGISRYDKTSKLESKIEEMLKGILGDGFKSNESDGWWYGWKYVSFENAFSELKILIDKVSSKIKNTELSL